MRETFNSGISEFIIHSINPCTLRYGYNQATHIQCRKVYIIRKENGIIRRWKRKFVNNHVDLAFLEQSFEIKCYPGDKFYMFVIISFDIYDKHQRITKKIKVATARSIVITMENIERKKIRLINKHKFEVFEMVLSVSFYPNYYSLPYLIHNICTDHNLQFTKILLNQIKTVLAINEYSDDTSNTESQYFTSAIDRELLLVVVNELLKVVEDFESYSKSQDNIAETRSIDLSTPIKSQLQNHSVSPWKLAATAKRLQSQCGKSQQNHESDSYLGIDEIAIPMKHSDYCQDLLHLPKQHLFTMSQTAVNTKIVLQKLVKNLPHSLEISISLIEKILSIFLDVSSKSLEEENDTDDSPGNALETSYYSNSLPSVHSMGLTSNASSHTNNLPVNRTESLVSKLQRKTSQGSLNHLLLSSGSYSRQQLTTYQVFQFRMIVGVYILQQSLLACNLLKEFSDLSPLELTALRKMFLRYDSTLSSEILGEDLYFLLQDLQEEYSVAETSIILKEIDKDDIGVIEFADFIKWWCSSYSVRE